MVTPSGGRPFYVKKLLSSGVLSLLFAALMSATTPPVSAQRAANSPRMGISYIYPTTYDDWGNAYLAGNGKMGIMVFGNPLNETIIYNDRGFNLAKTNERSFAQVSPQDIEAIRQLCADGKFAEANKLAVSSAQYKGGGEGSRHPGYKMLIAIPEEGPVRNYSRTCDFRTGEITVKWADSRGNWERKSFVSRKDNVTVQYLTAPSKAKLSCTIRLSSEGMHFPANMSFANEASNDGLNIRASYGANTNGAGYEGVTRIVTSGGTKSVQGNVLTITGANSVMMLTRTAKYYSDSVNQWNRKKIQADLAALPTKYSSLLAGQIATHGAIYDRVRLDLNASPADRSLSNSELLDRQRKSATPVKALWERAFDAGRYYYLSSSSELAPPDLLGIWTGDSDAGWGGFYHLDANLNLQVGGGNIGDMPEAMEGYFHIMESWREGFQISAKKLLGTRGMVAAGNTPGIGAGLMASISDYYPYQYATGEAPWLLYPMWEHYLVTGDKAFLRDRLYPLLREMGYFYEDFLTKTDNNGKYIFAGSISPENQPSNIKVSLLNNSTFDISGARFALSALIETCNTLDLDKGAGQGVEKWKKILDKLPPYLINEDGAVQEWSWPNIKDAYGHRHSSQLLTIWPYREFTPENNPVLFNASAMTLAKKDAFDYGTGHGYLHSALIAAGLNNAPALNSKLLFLLRKDFYYDSLCTSHNPNHDTFCTDIVNTVPTVMMEMLVSSRPGVLELLPALPASLDKGSISGVKGRNRVTIQDLNWDMTANSLSCTLKSDIDQSITLIERSGIEKITTKAKVNASAFGPIARDIQLKAGASTKISMALGDLRKPAVNMALNQNVSVSSVGNDYAASNVTDGDLTTRWSSVSTDNQWVTVDLGVSKTINQVRLNWEAAAGKDYDIEVSDDAKSWTTVKSIAGNSKTGWLEYPDLNTKGRYLRINGKSRATEYGFSLWEIEIF